MFFKLPKGLHAPPETAGADAHSRALIDATRVSGRMPATEFVSPFLSYLHMEDGPMFDPFRIPGSRSLHDRKMATWALLIGETYSSAVHAETRRRPHRGMLPDVDFSRAVPDPGRPSLVRRFIRMMRPGEKGRAGDISPATPGSSPTSGSPGASGSSGTSAGPVGETPATPYIARSRAGDADDSVSPARGVARPKSLVDQSRAARAHGQSSARNVPLV